MSQRLYQGQLFQTQTTEARLTTPDGLIDFRLQTWEDLKLEYGAEGKIVNNTDGSIGGYVTDVVKTSGGIKMRRDEADALEDAVFAAYNPASTGLGFLQIVFGLTVVYGNVVSKLRRDIAVIKFQKFTVDCPKGSDPLMVDHPLMVLDYKRNNRSPIVFPV